MTTKVGLSDSIGSSLTVKYERISSGSFLKLDNVMGEGGVGGRDGIRLGGDVTGRDGARLRGGVGVGDEARLGAAELRGRVLGPSGDTGAREEAEDEIILDCIRPDPFLMCSFMYWV